MILCITEKPSVARDIADILKADRRHDGFYEGGGYCVTWTFGHLCCLKDPDDYTPMLSSASRRRPTSLSTAAMPARRASLYSGG